VDQAKQLDLTSILMAASLGNVCALLNKNLLAAHSDNNLLTTPTNTAAQLVNANVFHASQLWFVTQHKTPTKLLTNAVALLELVTNEVALLNLITMTTLLTMKDSRQLT